MVFLTHLVLGPGQHYLPQMRKLRLKKQGAAQGSAAGNEPRKQLVDRARFLHVGFRKIPRRTPTLLWPRSTPSSPPGRSMALSCHLEAQSLPCSPQICLLVASHPPPLHLLLCVFLRQQM